MKYGSMPYVPKEVSRIICGTASPSFLAGRDDDALLEEIEGMGINTFDLARNYGEAESLLGRWMQKRGNRKDLVLISKCAHPDDAGNKRLTERDIREDFKKSADALQTDYIGTGKSESERLVPRDRNSHDRIFQFGSWTFLRKDKER